MLNFAVNTKFMVGKGAISRIPYEMQYFNSSRALIIADSFGEKYLATFLRKINNYDITIDVVTVGDESKIADVDAVIQKFEETGANAIIALGGGSAIDISKAVNYAVSRGCAKFRNVKDNLPSFNNISLFMVPSVLGAKNCASKRIILLDEFGKHVVIHNKNLQANAIILDPTMTKYVRESEVIEKGIFAAVHCLIAIVKDISVFARGYAIAGINLAREWGYENYTKDSSQQDRRFAAMVSCVYGGLAGDDDEDMLLTTLAMSISDGTKINYFQAYNALALRFIELYMKESKDGALGLNAFVGVDNALKYDKAIRSASVFSDIMQMLVSFRTKYDQKLFLSDYGIRSEDIKNS